MGYVSTKTGPMQLNPSASRALMLQQRAGLGDAPLIDPSTLSLNIPQTTLTLPSLPPAYADTSTFTGLPLVWEIALGLVGTFVLFRLTQKTSRRVRAGVRAARRA